MIDIFEGDNLPHLKTFLDNSYDAMITDPPYGLSQHPQKDIEACLTAWMKGEHTKAGFMGHSWDSFVPGPELWKETYRVLKPGGHALIFCATRTVDLMGIALRLSGFEIRDTIHWVYGSGMPKGHAHLKPSHEIIFLVRKPPEGTVAENMEAYGTGGLNIDACRIPTKDKLEVHSSLADRKIYGRIKPGRKSTKPGQLLGRWPPNTVIGHSPDCTEVCVGDCSCMQMDQQSVVSSSHGGRSVKRTGISKERSSTSEDPGPEGGDVGGASRYFFQYCPKPSKKEKAGNKHPTVKPVALMQWLCRLITPPGGKILDPFAGSGTTGVAAQLEGFEATLIERHPPYIEEIRARLASLPRSAPE